VKEVAKKNGLLTVGTDQELREGGSSGKSTGKRGRGENPLETLKKEGVNGRKPIGGKASLLLQKRGLGPNKNPGGKGRTQRFGGNEGREEAIEGTRKKRKLGEGFWVCTKRPPLEEGDSSRGPKKKKPTGHKNFEGPVSPRKKQKGGRAEKGGNRGAFKG